MVPKDANGVNAAAIRCQARKEYKNKRAFNL